ncbi:MAG: DUF4906 domain-containing protein [Alistipes sp.]|nr:DUF4906 domain-containing protein [Alistipes sp.]
MRYTRFIAAFMALFVATACISTPEDVTIKSASNRYLQVVGRVTQFSDCDVATRSKKSGDEPKVTTMGLALFPITEDGTIENCLYYDFKEGSSIVFIVDRHDDVFTNYDNRKFAMYVFANMQDSANFPTKKEEGVGKSLDYFMSCAADANVDVAKVPANGFPMMGSLGAGNITNAADSDAKTLILKPTKSETNTDALPIVDGVPTDNLEIPMKAMYAKFTFTISVKPDQEIVGNKAPRFDITKYTVHNLADQVDFKSATNDDKAVVESSNSYSPATYAQGATTITLDFYLPERYLTPADGKGINDVLPDELKKGTYDTVVDKDQNGYRDQDEKYHQRFKNKLPGDNQKATYVTIEGKFLDHQGYTYDVAYNIYLGGNNYDDFNIIRNTHYINSVTIRGIATSSDQAINTDGISIDWRVNVERSTPLVINLRRESLLDAHYEVRPLRLRLVGENIPTGTSATVTILNEDGTTNNLPDWIRLEKSGTGNDYIASGVSTGKRKYFTVDLVTNTLQSGTSITLDNLTTANQTLWIYVDENTDTKSRAAIVRVTYQGVDTVDTDYKIVQNGLFEVVGADSGNTYYIEQYEEYLYNYDAEDDYGQTKDEGMVWGLDGVQLSNEHNSFYIDEDNDEWNNYVENTSILKYDYYIGKYDSFVSDGVTVHGFAGQHFTNEIFENSNGNVKALTMDQQPSGAVEYCYNRNKRNSDGTIAKVEWYLPSADELEDFIVPAYASFKEFQNNYYWTSQPAFIRSAFYYQYKDNSDTITDAYAFVAYEDNTNYARATKVVAKGNDVFDYALSGLNKIPTDAHEMDNTCKSKNEILLADSYFNVMYAWYRNSDGSTEPYTWTNDTHYDEKKDGKSTGVRYHVHVGHSFDKMYQVDENGDHGYHPRTKKNRVRCVRRDWNPNNNYEAEIVYTLVGDTPTPATELDTSGSTMYVMRNTNYTSTYLTTSGTNLAASNATISKDNIVVIEGNYIKSVAKNQYFNGDDGNVSFSDSATSYDINPSGNAYTISVTSGWLISTTYYLKQSDTAVSMSEGNSGNTSWQFYEVKKEYQVVE